MSKIEGWWWLALALVACDATEVTDAGTDAGPPPSCPVLASFEPGDTEGAASPLVVPGGEARAGRVTAAQLPDDPDGLAGYRGGDFVLANERIAALVSAADSPGQNYDPYGGRLVGLALHGDGTLERPVDLNLIVLGVSRFLVATEAVGVVNDGSDGGPAVVRAVGPLAAIDALGGLLETLAPGELGGLPAAIDYELAPGTEYVDVFLTVRATERGASAPLGALQLFFQSYRTAGWVEGDGFGARTDPPRFIAFDGDTRTSFAWVAPEGTLRPLYNGDGVDLLTTGFIGVAPCGEERFHLGRVAVGGPGLPGVQRVVASLDDVVHPRVEGRVTRADGSAAAGVRVHVLAGEEHLTRVRTAVDGTFGVGVPERADRIVVYREGFPLTEVAVTDNPVRITLPASGAIEVTATDADTAAGVPARIEVFAAEPPADPPVAFGEVLPGHGRARLELPVDGHVVMPLPPGSYRVEVSHGPEYERVVRDVMVAADATATVEASLERSVDTAGVMCADFHIHSHRSVDSADSATYKVRGLAADGLEIAVRSEHEWVSDYAPVVASLGLGGRVLGLAGIELTTFDYGHFGVFPLVPDATRSGGGAFPWADRLAPALFDDVRARPEAPLLIINHPRAGGLNQGYFSTAGFDRTTGMVSHPELWDDTFEVIEAFNASDFESNRNETVADWFALLGQGRRVFVVGSSDSHRLADQPVGYPRTCLYLGTDDPAATDGDAVRDAARAGRSYVSGGIYLDVDAGGVGPGETASGVGASTMITVTVRAAAFIEVNRLEVIVDGVTTETMPIVPNDTDPLDATVRLSAPLSVDVAPGGSWVVVHVSGDTPFDTNGDRPFAVSNPIFLTR